MAELTKDRNDRGQKWVCRSDLGRRLVTWRSEMHAIINSSSSSSSSSSVVVVVVVVLKMSEHRSKDLYVQILHNTMY